MISLLLRWVAGGPAWRAGRRARLAGVERALRDRASRPALAEPSPWLRQRTLAALEGATAVPAARPLWRVWPVAVAAGALVLAGASLLLLIERPTGKGGLVVIDDPGGPGGPGSRPPGAWVPVLDGLDLRPTLVLWTPVESPLLREVRLITRDTKRAAALVLDRLSPPAMGGLGGAEGVEEIGRTPPL